MEAATTTRAGMLYVRENEDTRIVRDRQVSCIKSLNARAQSPFLHILPKHHGHLRAAYFRFDEQKRTSDSELLYTRYDIALIFDTQKVLPWMMMLSLPLVSQGRYWADYIRTELISYREPQDQIGREDPRHVVYVSIVNRSS